MEKGCKGKKNASNIKEIIIYLIRQEHCVKSKTQNKQQHKLKFFNWGILFGSSKQQPNK
jgi:hypothetical protein